MCRRQKAAKAKSELEQQARKRQEEEEKARADAEVCSVCICVHMHGCYALFCMFVCCAFGFGFSWHCKVLSQYRLKQKQNKATQKQSKPTITTKVY